jgi:hypothetical protein
MGIAMEILYKALFVLHFVGIAAIGLVSLKNLQRRLLV